MTLYYSILIEGQKTRHTSTIEYFKEVDASDPQFAGHKKTMIQLCRNALIKKLDDWNQPAEKIISSHFFYRKDGKEIFFFKWDK